MVARSLLIFIFKFFFEVMGVGFTPALSQLATLPVQPSASMNELQTNAGLEKSCLVHTPQV